MKYNPMDLGLDMERAKALPECQACRKKSDGAIKCKDGTVLCGTHFDQWLGLMEDPLPTAQEFAKELREGKYKPCWEAKLDT